jgi:outer membrane receptor protein involved in Fe transport
LRRIQARQAEAGANSTRATVAATLSRSRQLFWRAAPVASVLLGCIPAVRAADADTGTNAGLAEVVVTAEKRAENLQDVPVSIQALGTEKLEEMNVKSFDDYVKLLPSVSFQGLQGPSFQHTYMRGVASGGDGNHSGSLPSVGMYLDEQPVTTIDGNLNIHIYDIERVEALSGPQGTLYGASSEAGTIRIITNKPDPSGFKAGYDLEGNTVAHGGQGYVAEGFVNMPLSSNAAVRLVGWYEKDAGYVNNVHGQVTFPTGNIPFDNANLVRDHYNDVETRGGRAALKVDLADTWTILPQVIGQVSSVNGNVAYNPAVGDLETVKFLPEYTHDSWVQSALTIEGKISNFDLVYSGAYLTRNTHEYEDYTDYSLAYDATTGVYWVDNAGNLINPAQYIKGRDRFTKLSNEVRISSPQTWPVRFTAGLFMQRQVHDILQDYVINNGTPLTDTFSVPGWPGTIWLTDEERVDRDSAAFTEIAWDIFDTGLTLNTGIRYYTFDNTLGGFYGFNANYSSHEGTATCINNIPFHGAPCSDLDGRSTGSGNTPKINLTYKFDKNKMVYFTWSKGFRPGGVNRNGGGTLPPYKPDYLTNYELGWKTTWLDNSLRWNAAVFDEKWKSFQFSYLGPNALTIIANAGQAEIRGVESDLEWAVTRTLTLSAGMALLDPKLTQAYCAGRHPELCGVDPTYEQYAPNGEQLPVTPHFKGNLTARYNFPVLSYTGYLQGALEYVGSRWADLRLVDRQTLGQEPAYTITDFSAGLNIDKMTVELYANNAFDRRAVIDRYTECGTVQCGPFNIYTVPNQPRTIGLRFGQRF